MPWLVYLINADFWTFLGLNWSFISVFLSFSLIFDILNPGIARNLKREKVLPVARF
jgi:hypothetical protein